MYLLSTFSSSDSLPVMMHLFFFMYYYSRLAGTLFDNGFCLVAFQTAMVPRQDVRQWSNFGAMVDRYSVLRNDAALRVTVNNYIETSSWELRMALTLVYGSCVPCKISSRSFWVLFK